MTKKDLVKIIQEVVKREVQKEVKKLFIKENKSSLKSLAPKPKKVTKPIQKRESVQYTSNESLNKVLNETVGLGQADEMDEYPTMGGGVFDSSRATELLGYGDSMRAGGDKEAQRNINAAMTMKEAGVSSEQVPESLVNALTRDYSDLMKHDKMKSKK
jgi:hypothetical protein